VEDVPDKFCAAQAVVPTHIHRAHDHAAGVMDEIPPDARRCSFAQ
jgi:hypothetical protein